MAGSKEDAETVSAFFQDMRGRGLGDPLLVAPNDLAEVIKAIETGFPPLDPKAGSQKGHELPVTKLDG